jgi:uncharacterized protein (DUF1330 family)
MLKSALLVTAGIIVGVGATQLTALKAATGPSAYVVYEANVTDQDAYTKALPEAQKLLKEHGATLIAGGFNKAKATMGAPAANRYVIIRYENQDAVDKFWEGGGKAWVEKNAPTARSVTVEGLEAH